MKGIRARLEEHRPWFRKNFYGLFIIVGILISTVGLYFYVLFVNAPAHSFTPSVRGFLIARNQTITPTSMNIILGIDPMELYSQYFFGCEANGTYDFLFVFPVQILSKIATSMNMSVRSTPYGSAMWLHYDVADALAGVGPKWHPGEEIWGWFSINNTFQSGTRGSYTFILPFTSSIDPSVTEDLWGQLSINSYDPGTPITFQFGLPGSHKILQTFPPISSGPDVWINPYNQTRTTIEWSFGSLEQTLTIQSEDPNEIARYDTLPFMSGILIGVGVPITTAALYDRVKEWTLIPQKRSRKHRSIDHAHLLRHIVTTLVVKCVFQKPLEKE
jgi:hypothetical protein